MAAKLKKGDKVVVLAGRDKGKEGEIQQEMLTDEQKAELETLPASIEGHREQARPVGGEQRAGD